MLKVPFIDLAPQYKRVRKESRAAALRVLESQRYILGEEGRQFESECAKFIGAKHALGVASGTDALILSLAALGVGPGDEVITTPFTFFATASSIVRVGARPVFCDIEEDSMNLEPSCLKTKITKKTRAIIPVHLFGRSCRMDEITAVAKKNGLAVVEDACQSFGASFRGKMTGVLGDAGCFSFYPTKNLGGAGDGGLITTDSDALADKLRLFRDHGSRKKYVHEIVGWNSRLDEMQAALLRVKLRSLKKWNAQRQKHAKAYNRAFKDLPVHCPVDEAGMESIHHLYTIRTAKRDALSAHLSTRGIGNSIYYPVPLHQQPCFKELGLDGRGLGESERASREVLSLPMFTELSASQIKTVIDGVRSFFKK